MPAAGAAGAAGVDDLGGPEQWFKSLPIITRYWFALAVTTTLAGNFKLIDVYRLVFIWEPLKDNFEVWRLVTPFLYFGSFSFGTLLGLYFLVEYSKRYESSSGYNTGSGGGTADYVFALMFASICILCSYPLFSGWLMPIFGKNLSYFVLYLWTKRYPTVQVSLWGFPIKALWLPFALLALTICMGSPGGDLIHGIVIGHLYYFLVDVVPLVYGKDYLHTPQFLINYFGIGAYNPPPTANPPATQQRPAGASGGSAFNAPGRVNPPENPGLRRRTTGATSSGGYNWGGGGHTLGSN